MCFAHSFVEGKRELAANCIHMQAHFPRLLSNVRVTYVVLLGKKNNKANFYNVNS